MSNLHTTGIRKNNPKAENKGRATIGWREWVALPELDIPAIKVKVDTGARTSALHAFRLETFRRGGRDYVRFWIHPLQKKTEIAITCEALLLDKRVVKDSGGHAEERYVIKTPIRIGDRQWEIELTLTSREDMMFRMLLGRSAIIDGELTVDPDKSFLHGRKSRKIYRLR